ncbi:MAG TPA: rhodanese-like domain-containing protein [Mycobacteriales bacterium]|jgi:Rhodanese-related sulfurtransferase
MRRSRVPEIRPSELSPTAVLLDVREDDEWQAGHAPEAVHVPMSGLPARLPEVPTGQALAVVCRSGGRSAQVAGWLLAQGYDAVNVAGGMQSWVAAGRPMVSETGQPPVVL